MTIYPPPLHKFQFSKPHNSVRWTVLQEQHLYVDEGFHDKLAMHDFVNVNTTRLENMHDWQNGG